jgi:hypothetical protein
MGTSAKLAPNTNNYVLGRGALYFDRFGAAGEKRGEIDIGNVTDFSVTPQVEVKDHYESREGLKEKDLSVIMQTGFSIKFTAEEYSHENLKLAILGETDSDSYLSQTAGTTSDNIVAYRDRWINLTYRSLTNTTVVVTDGGTTFVEGATRDYQVDYESGRILINKNGACYEQEALRVAYSYGAIAYPQLLFAERAVVQGQLRFVGNNTQGPNYEVLLWKVSLKPTSDIPFISDDWGKIAFEGEVMKDASNHPNDPFGYIVERKASTVLS